MNGYEQYYRPAQGHDHDTARRCRYRIRLHRKGTHTFARRALPFFYDPLSARIRLAAVCTSRRETAAKARGEAGLDLATADISEILRRKDIHVAGACTPNHLHTEALLGAIAAGKHIYCEKRLTARWDEAAEVARALQS